MTYARIIGTGSYVPEKVLTNADLSRMLGEDVDEFGSGVLGIRERHVCGDDESTADLATAAARRALEAAGVAAEELDLVVLATDTPEYISPATSVVVLAKAGLTHKDVSLFLFTQVNLSTIKIVMEKMSLPWERTHTVMGKWGYTGSACIPMVLDDAVREGKLKGGDVFVMCASGGGLNMACAAFRW